MTFDYRLQLTITENVLSFVSVSFFFRKLSGNGFHSKLQTQNSKVKRERDRDKAFNFSSVSIIYNLQTTLELLKFLKLLKCTWLFLLSVFRCIIISPHHSLNSKEINDKNIKRRKERQTDIQSGWRAEILICLFISTVQNTVSCVLQISFSTIFNLTWRMCMMISIQYNTVPNTNIINSKQLRSIIVLKMKGPKFPSSYSRHNVQFSKS